MGRGEHCGRCGWYRLLAWWPCLLFPLLGHQAPLLTVVSAAVQSCAPKGVMSSTVFGLVKWVDFSADTMQV